MSSTEVTANMAKRIDDICFRLLDSFEERNLIHELLNIIEQYPMFAERIWYYSCMQIFFIQELSKSYSILNTDKLTDEFSRYYCALLNTLQSLILNEKVKQHFLKGQFSFYLYPFLNISSQSQANENLKIASLGIIGTLLRGPENDTVKYFTNTELLPLLLKIMDNASDSSKMLATHIFLKILKTDEGLVYSLETFDRFVAIYQILNNMMYQSMKEPNEKIFEFVIDCFDRISDNEGIKTSLIQRKPDFLVKPELQNLICKYPVCENKYYALIEKLSTTKRI
ncbi:hypothetical protein EDEG_00033 [Edhazardia aedis USNM 41457]|uniref:Uncharacterized protein n=1 Tax=Edhazardia aedis (strain USNM 41457) TaxID=1003232 RepID=J9D1I5_EDHAE|nr:hypothetical protein EDEG_00033 [Edhazardia aedis USNM 41457]|eukprot:EJW01439.1 hypothetical protein EDEG_00033 [Edhazardia aedis USNM 41457]